MMQMKDGWVLNTFSPVYFYINKNKRKVFTINYRRMFYFGQIKNKYSQNYSAWGVGELGQNMYVVEVDDNIFVIDAGLMYPEDEMFGIDIVIPDITYLKENKDRVKGIFISHGHEDHTGALPYLLSVLSVPVYGTKLTIALTKIRLEQQKSISKLIFAKLLKTTFLILIQ